MTDITAMLWALVAKVDQLAAEWRDPDTPIERKLEIREYLLELYNAITEVSNS